LKHDFAHYWKEGIDSVIKVEHELNHKMAKNEKHRPLTLDLALQM